MQGASAGSTSDVVGGRDARRVRILIMSPGDVAEERHRLQDVVAELQRSVARDYGLTLEPVLWERMTGSMGSRPQAVVNEQAFAEPIDIAIGILWGRFGTPSGGEAEDGRPYLSGTQEEFEEVLTQHRSSGTGWPQILLYRCVRPLRPGRFSSDQYAMVEAFFEQVGADGRYPGLVQEYESTQQLVDRSFGDLSTVLGRYRRERMARERTDAVTTAARPTAAAVPADWEAGYLRRLQQDLTRLPLPMPQEGQARHCALPDVYVPLPLRAASGPTEGDAAARLLRSQRTVVTGDAGSGKSTLLRHVALTEVRCRTDAAAPGRGRLPVWIDLVDAAARLRRVEPDLALLDPDAWLPVLAAETSLPEDGVRALLARGDVLLIFDMLDEVPDPAHRRALAAGIARLQKEGGPLHSPLHVLVGCRRGAVEDAALAGFDEVRIEAMGRTTRDDYLQSWCRQMWGVRADRALTTLDRAIRASSAVADLATNPQIATMLARVAATDELPLQRVLLYDYVVETVVASDRLRVHGGPTTVRSHLVALALALQHGGAGSGTLDLPSATRLLAERTDGGDARRLLEDLALHTGLLRLDRPLGASHLGAVVRFQHRTFQEFLVACHCADHADDLLPHAVDPAWLEILALTAGVLAARGDPRLRDLLERLLAGPVADVDGGGTDDLVAEAPRVAAASACLTELAGFDVDADVLTPVRAAYERLLPALRRVPVADRVRIATGLGSVRDPRLTASARWIAVPAGSFVRGTDAPDAWPQERPALSVHVSAFFVQRWPVTVAEYRRFVEEGRGYEDDTWWDVEGLVWRRAVDPRAPEDWERQRPFGNRPVTGVCWWEASAYCRWMSEEGDTPAGWRLSLPTEAQWERAAHGSAVAPSGTRRFPWGDAWGQERANCHPLTLGVCPVGLFAGDADDEVWDLAGNVGERCLDGFAPYAAGPAEVLEDPLQPDRRHGHVVRGGDWTSHPMDVRTTARFGAAMHSRDHRTGFRVVGLPEGQP